MDQQITGETRNNKLKIKTASHLFLFAIVVKEMALKRKLDNNSTVSGKIKSLVNISQSIPLVCVPIISTDRPDTVYMYRLSFCTNKKHWVGEGSKDMHSLVKVIAETKVANMARALGSGKGHVRRGAGQSGLPSEEIPVYLLHQSPEPLPPQQAVFSGVGSCGSCRQEGPDPQVGGGQEKGQASMLHA